MDLSIVIVTHNSLSPVEKCLRSLEKHPPGGQCEVIVVDNASSDGTPDMIRESFSSVRLIANKDNRGYSKGVNQAFLASSGRYFLVLNPDIIVGKDSIDALVSQIEADVRRIGAEQELFLVRAQGEGQGDKADCCGRYCQQQPAGLNRAMTGL